MPMVFLFSVVNAKMSLFWFYLYISFKKRYFIIKMLNELLTWGGYVYFGICLVLASMF